MVEENNRLAAQFVKDNDALSIEDLDNSQAIEKKDKVIDLEKGKPAIFVNDFDAVSQSFLSHR